MPILVYFALLPGSSVLRSEMMSSCSMRHGISEAIVFLPPSVQKVEQRNLQDSTAMQGTAQHCLLNLFRVKLLERTEAHL